MIYAQCNWFNRVYREIEKRSRRAKERERNSEEMRGKERKQVRDQEK